MHTYHFPKGSLLSVDVRVQQPVCLSVKHAVCGLQLRKDKCSLVQVSLLTKDNRKRPECSQLLRCFGIRSSFTWWTAGHQAVLSSGPL